MRGILKDGRKTLRQLSSLLSNNECIVFKDGWPRIVSVRQVRGTGWMYYVDTAHTSGTPLNVNNESKQITINGLGAATQKKYRPCGVQELWNNNKITPENIGDSYVVRLDFMALAGSNSDQFDIFLDIGFEVLRKTFEINKNTGQTESFSFDTDVFTLSTFVSNGGTLSIETSNDIDFYDFTLLIKRDHKEA